MDRDLPRYVSAFTDRHGQERIRFRRNGETIYMRSKPETPEFKAEYDALMASGSAIVAPPPPAVDPLSFSALAREYYASPEFAALSDSTQKTYRGILTRFCAEYGHLSARTIQLPHIQAILNTMKDRPTAAMNLRKRIRGLLNWARPETKRTDDPCMLAIAPRPAEPSNGFHAWTNAEIQKFRAFYAKGTRERLAFELMLNLAARRSDAHRLGPKDIEEGFLKFVPFKNRRRHPETISVPVRPELAELIEAIPETQEAFVLSSLGRPYKAASFGNWIRDICDAADLPRCTSHGLRKATARRLAESGKTTHEIMAVGGWHDIKTVERYTRSASQKKLAARALGVAYDEIDDV